MSKCTTDGCKGRRKALGKCAACLIKIRKGLAETPKPGARGAPR